ncbi:MAG: tRNA 2-thiocytidine(32) synthetase TtcA [Clostridia bacterium]|nr:tRNA 2-thiocytidine(32) synthetase TtcA [Clostridia bacterium]MBR6646245.1 tRNA 2-thiocytidine(32) synthetase TtcA [Clostridia bacterium]
MKRIVGLMRRAAEDYNMIDEGETIAVGVSGGKDSLMLLSALAKLSEFYPKKFNVVAITLDMGFDGMDFSPIKDFCNELGVPYYIEKTDIKKIVFDLRQEKNPCALCANLRRGALHSAAKERGINKIALGHHYDDAVETFMLSLIYEGRVSGFAPKTYLDRQAVTLIRPLIYVQEKDIRAYTKSHNLPVVESTCEVDGNTKRQYIKDLIVDIDKDARDVKKRLFTAMRNAVDGWGIN